MDVMFQLVYLSFIGDNNCKLVKCSFLDCWCFFQKLRFDCFLVQCIINYVLMDIMVNIFFVIGVFFVMVYGGLNILMLINEGNLEKFMMLMIIFQEWRVKGYVVEYDIFLQRRVLYLQI